MDEMLARDSEVLRDLVHRFGQSFSRRMLNSLLIEEINLPQYNTLHALAQMGETSMGELSERMGVTMGASTNIVDKLVRGGMAARRRDPKDRRMVRVQLTGRGVQAVEKVISDCTRFLEQMLSAFTPEEREPFISTYRRLVEACEQQTLTGEGGDGPL